MKLPIFIKRLFCVHQPKYSLEEAISLMKKYGARRIPNYCILCNEFLPEQTYTSFNRDK